MEQLMFDIPLTPEEAADLNIQAAKAFQPRAPISARNLFAGRWEQITTLVDAVSQMGLHIIIFGERGVGKTSLANIVEPILSVMEESLRLDAPDRLVVKVNIGKGDTFGVAWARAFDEVSWFQNKPVIGLQPTSEKQRMTLREAFAVSNHPTIDEVRKTLSVLSGSVFIFDEFDRGPKQLRTGFTDLIKSLSDYTIDSTVVIVGVSETIDMLIEDHASITRSVVQIQLPRMRERELHDILEKGGALLKMKFEDDASSLIVRMSQGLPHYTHLIGLHSVRAAANRKSRMIKAEDVHKSFEKAITQAIQSIQGLYLKAVRSAHKDALYTDIILACASAASTSKDALGYFYPSDVTEPLAVILGRDNVVVATFQKHINEFCEEARGPVLERHGMPRGFKFRFTDPLLPPYVFMNALKEGQIDSASLKSLTSV
jgi:Cdc6-like AAA superfamily ATPase